LNFPTYADRNEAGQRLDLLKKTENIVIFLKFGPQIGLIGRQAIGTTWINTEVDKIVAVFYFLFTVLIFTLALFIKPSFFTTHFTGLSIAYPPQLILYILEWIFIVVTIAVMLAIISAITNLRKRVKTVSIYMIATGTESNDLSMYIQNISQFLSVKDWEMAELWSRILENKLSDKGFISRPSGGRGFWPWRRLKS
jgi:hypothetical protein